MRNVQSIRPDGSIHIETIFDEDTITQQQFADDCDINLIVKKFLKTGILPDSKVQPMYADVSEIKTFADYMNMIKIAEESFNSLPSEVRDRFANDPVNLVEFVEDPANVQECLRMGLMELKDDSKEVSIDNIRNLLKAEIKAVEPAATQLPT